MGAYDPKSRWLGEEDSNLRSPDPESGVLPVTPSPIRYLLLAPLYHLRGKKQAPRKRPHSPLSAAAAARRSRQRPGARAEHLLIDFLHRFWYISFLFPVPS